MHVSLYGHDKVSFIEITQKGHIAYKRLVANLEYLTAQLTKYPDFKLKLGWRTSRKALKEAQNQGSDIINAVQTLERHLGDTPNIFEFNNWGGVIAPSDIIGLDLELNDGRHVVKDGLCVLTLSRTIVLADGRVNACACRDVEGSLVVGNVQQEPLSWILSYKNPAYKDLLASHMDGRFPKVCQSCDFYQSVFLPQPNQPYDRIVTLPEAMNFVE